MANIKVFRRFLENSIKASDLAVGYVENFINEVLTQAGRDAFLQKFKQVFKVSTSPNLFLLNRTLSSIFRNEAEKPKATAVLMGFTRKRELYRSHFADDDSLWVPSLPTGMG